MSTVVIPGKHSYFLGSRAYLVEEDKELADNSWASKHIIPNPALKWIVGRYVEADNPNRNRQLFSLADLEIAKPSVKYGPMNMVHIQNRIVGAFTNTEMIYPTAEQASSEPVNPYLEALAVYWKAYFPKELALIEAAHADGSLFFSMEAVAKTVTFRDGASEETFPYKGPHDISYGAWNENASAVKQLNEPLFLGGALIIPPTRPGWANADIKEISKYVEEHQELAEKVYSDVASEADHLDAKQIEDITLALLARGISLEDGNLIKSSSSPKDKSQEDIGNRVDSDEGGAVMADKTYTEAELKAAIADAVAPLQAEIDAAKAKENDEAVEARISEAHAEANLKVEELQKSLDTAVLEAEAAKTELANSLAWIQAVVDLEAAAKEMAARREDRLARVKEVASFPDEYVDANADRWVAMDDESFEATLEDYKAVAVVTTAKVETPGEGDAGKEALASTAMKAAADKGERTARSDLHDVLSFRNNGIDPRMI